ncbi:T9SS type A sorting domain-containing protein [Flavobacterium tructae]|uniref:T9SS type A sorting domain-containing protein n=1 Tax=Flavobacterium tructae TaxID=1114873 RepID=UPI002551D498|nr:T9SS type A sorting domain-containing protein [Flavobacterium tructae]MDL2144634.1 T9SS type A sorting domain-containing protein [Flavobacterium tructae]
MKKNLRTFLILFITVFSFITNGYSQESVVVSGGNATGNGGSSSYSVGQIAYTSLPGGANGFVLQGVQQAYEIISLGNDEFKGITLAMTAYPNPAVDVLSLTVSTNEWNNLSCQLFDTNGKIVSKKVEVTSLDTSVPMQGLNSGIYFLTVSNSGKAIKTFKIIKK